MLHAGASKNKITLMASGPPFSLYIHIPYCALKCPYCDFNVRVVREIPEREYTNAIVRELAYYADSDGWRGRGLKTIFFGGGTPSLFSPEAIGAMRSEEHTSELQSPYVIS